MFESIIKNYFYLKDLKVYLNFYYIIYNNKKIIRDLKMCKDKRFIQMKSYFIYRL